MHLIKSRFPIWWIRGMGKENFNYYEINPVHADVDIIILPLIKKIKILAFSVKSKCRNFRPNHNTF